MLTDILNKLFGQKKFKSDVYEDAVYAILEGEHNVCIRMPPKSGKSICYQLPACMQKGKVALIISPTLNRIKRHIQFLHSRGINAYCYTTKRGGNQRMRLIQNISSNASKATLVYITAEISTYMDFKELVKYLKRRKLISYVVIEEADCISRIGPHSKWYYTGIRRLRYLLASMPVILMTTIGTKEIMDDVLKHLRLCKPIIYSVPMHCPSVYYDVWYLETLQAPFDHLKDYIVKSCGYFHMSALQEKKNKCIIYCKSKDTTELIASKLNLLAVPTVACHSALKNQPRTIAKKKWLSGEVQVIAVTTDIEADVQKDSIGCIVHWMIPESISKFYLRTSNVNVHIDKVYSRVYFSNKAYTDLRLSEKEGNTLTVKRLRMKKRELVTTISFCLLQECRHVFISSYFGEKLSPCKSLCDVCCETEQITKRVVDFKAYVEGNTPQEEENVLTPMDLTPDMFDDESDQQNSETAEMLDNQFDPKVELSKEIRKLFDNNQSKYKQMLTLLSIDCDIKESDVSSKDINRNNKNHDNSRTYIEEPTFSGNVKTTNDQIDPEIELNRKIYKDSEEEKIRCSQMPVLLPIECDTKKSQDASESINPDKNYDSETCSENSIFSDAVKGTSEQFDRDVECNHEIQKISEEVKIRCSQTPVLLPIKCDTKISHDASERINLKNKNDDEIGTYSEDSIFRDIVNSTNEEVDMEVQFNKEIQNISEKNQNKNNDDESRTTIARRLFGDEVKRSTEQLGVEPEFITEIKGKNPEKDQRKHTQVPTIVSIEYVPKMHNCTPKYIKFNDTDRNKNITHNKQSSCSDAISVTSESSDPEVEFITEIKRNSEKGSSAYTLTSDSQSTKSNTKTTYNTPKCINLKDKQTNKSGTSIELCTVVPKTNKCQQNYRVRRDNLPKWLLSKEYGKHAKLNMGLTNDIHVRNSKRKAVMTEDEVKRHTNKRKKYDPQDASTSSIIDSYEYTISATQTKVDVAKNLMAKYKLNDNEVSLVPLKRSKSTPQNER